MPPNRTNRAVVDGTVFEKFCTDHPDVMEVITDWAWAEYSAGASYASISEMWCRYRSRQGPRGGRVEFGMDDRLKAYLVRMIVTDHPELRPMFDLRPAAGADAWWRGYLRRHDDVTDVPRPRPGDDYSS